MKIVLRYCVKALQLGYSYYKELFEEILIHQIKAF